MSKYANAFVEILTLAVGNTPDGLDDKVFDSFSDKTIGWITHYFVDDDAPDECDVPESAYVFVECNRTGILYCYERDTHVVVVSNDEAHKKGYFCIPIKTLRGYMRELAVTPIARYLHHVRPIVRAR